jgi:hypothetical protein
MAERDRIGVALSRIDRISTIPDTFAVVEELACGRSKLLIARSPSGQAAALVVGLSGSRDAELEAHGLRCRVHDRVRLELREGNSEEAALSMVCLVPELRDAFAGLVSSMAHHLASQSPLQWSDLARLLSSWSVLFAQPRRMSPERELGLWGELWVLANTSRVDALIGGWRGPDGGNIDFHMEGGALEVKTTTRPGVHHVSWSQSPAIPGNGYLLSLSAEHGGGGSTCAELIELISRKTARLDLLHAALARAEFSLVANPLERRWDLTRTPIVVPIDALPRIHGMDPGISEVRYVMTIDLRNALADQALERALEPFGLESEARRWS